MYHIKGFYPEQDVELLFGKGVKANYFNDDALGNTLNKLYVASPPKSLFCHGPQGTTFKRGVVRSTSLIFI